MVNYAPTWSLTTATVVDVDMIVEMVSVHLACKQLSSVLNRLVDDLDGLDTSSIWSVLRFFFGILFPYVVVFVATHVVESFLFP